ncbi:hypothetical protein ACTFIR_004664 [Dictyostelium discoideum]
MNNMNAALLINNKNVGLVDTGSSLTIIWESIAKKLNLKVDAKQISVNSASNNKIKIIGTNNTTIKLGNASARISVNIVKDNDTSIDCIFGIDTIMGLNLIIDLREMIPSFWRGWVYHLNPCRYFMEGIVTNILKTVDVKCSDEDMAIFTFPKSFNTCQNYTSAFESYGPSGYVTKDATLNGEPACGYCIYKNGEEYYQTLDWSADNRWRNVGIIISFFVFNILMVILFIYLTRKGSR